MSNKQTECIICNKETGDYMERANIPLCAPCVAQHGYDKMPLGDFFDWLGEAMGLIEETAVLPTPAADDWYAMVREFHIAFNHPVAHKPAALTDKRAYERADFMMEEIDEFITSGDLVGQADAMIDLIYFAIGTMVEIGVHPDAVFRMVHNANMRKLFPDGRPRWRDIDGKVLKPDGWVGPEREIERQIRGYNRYKMVGEKLPEVNGDRLIDSRVQYNV